MLIALAEPNATALVLTVFGLLMAFSVLFTRALDRAGVPVVLLFLVLGMLGGSEGLGGVAFDDFAFAFRIGTVALILILFDGGLNTTWASIRRSAGPAGLLATVGVAATGGLLAGCARLCGLSWTESLLIGAIVSSTDAAAVLAVLRGGGLRLKERVRSILEVESCINDPMAIILTFAVIELVSGESTSIGWLALSVAWQLVSGLAIGLLFGFAARWALVRVPISAGGLFPVVTLAFAFLAFGAATLAAGSGFLAVFAAGAVLGNGTLPYRAGLARVHDAVAWLSQVGMFLMLGLLVYPSQLPAVAGVGLLLGLTLSFLARPLAAAGCVLPFRLPLRETGYIGWVGLRGAVPIILATFPVLAGLPDGLRIFHIVFFIVVVSTLLPGATIAPLTRRLRLEEPGPPTPSVALEMHSLRQMNGEVQGYLVTPALAVCGASLAEIEFPPGAAAILVVRGRELLAARGPTRLEAGDHVYVFFKPEDEQYIGLLFGQQLGT